MSEKTEYRFKLLVPRGDDGKWDFNSVKWLCLERVRHLYCVGVEIEIAVPDRKEE